MMLWVNLIMDTMGALALGTESPSSSLLLRQPYKRNTNLVSNLMMRNILIQYCYQLILIQYVYYYGNLIFPNMILESIHHKSILFNIFVFCQIFNELNSRSISNDYNIFNNLFNNYIFMFIIIFTISIQYVIIEYGSDFIQTIPLTTNEWLKCILLGSLSLTIGGLMRCIPIQDNKNDYAQLPEILIKHQQNAMKLLIQENKFIHINKTISFSGIIWFITVCSLPLIAYQVFVLEPHLYQ